MVCKLDGLSNVDTYSYMRTKLSKWGNSLALRLPKQFVLSQNLYVGVDLEIKEERDGFFVQALPDKLTLSDLLEEVRPGNLHGESFVDDPQGKEIW